MKRVTKAPNGPSPISPTPVAIASRVASLRMSTMSAEPPGRSTRCISASAPVGSPKFLKAARQRTQSKLAAGREGHGGRVPLTEVDRCSRALGLAPRDAHEFMADVEPRHGEAAELGDLDREIARTR